MRDVERHHDRDALGDVVACFFRDVVHLAVDVGHRSLQGLAIFRHAIERAAISMGNVLGRHENFFQQAMDVAFARQRGADLMLQLVRRALGSAAAATIARSMVTPASRPGSQAQYVPPLRTPRPGDLE